MKKIMLRLVCCWVGCDAVFTTCDCDELICRRCGFEVNLDHYYSCDSSRYEFVRGFLKYWLWYRWFPCKCDGCGKYPCDFSSDDCIPF